MYSWSVSKCFKYIHNYATLNHLCLPFFSISPSLLPLLTISAAGLNLIINLSLSLSLSLWKFFLNQPGEPDCHRGRHTATILHTQWECPSSNHHLDSERQCPTNFFSCTNPILCPGSHKPSPGHQYPSNYLHDNEWCWEVSVCCNKCCASWLHSAEPAGQHYCQR